MKITLSTIAIILLLIGIPSGIFPYGYYVLLRWIITGIAIYLVWLANRLNKKQWFWLMMGIAIIFNPIIPIHLNKGIWQVIDVAVAGIFIGSLFKFKTYERKN